ncbi:GlxA family transcriptional regulator [Peterkaempfera bronchialis]|uniref:Helix-turn-helix domain-containing protein n=1 Tax=Peterkaempfera bronchialis TaxID=2126346 RepID=A0A345SWM6_9ACTN|nr:helix-turn-helix domain-containing protein [Peterkaempfera bronchialis]AXI78131.1 helix-turn-helix domain-containing protein [Peterkaempfera bronchialis]
MGGPHRVAVLALGGVVAFELAIPSRILGSAKDPVDDGPLYEVATCTLDGGPVATSADFRISVDHGPELLEWAETVIVPAAYEGRPWFTEGRLSEPMAAALARIRPSTRMVSICTGSFVLAAAGLLDGRPATTHWRHTDRFRRLFPAVLLDPDVLFTDDGDVLTSGGVAAGVDLCLHLVRRDHGSAVANQVARTCIVPPWRDGGQSQYVDLPVPRQNGAAADTGGTAAARAWALARLGEPLGLRELAGQAGMSVRTFTRRFRDEVGTSPGQWLLLQRAERARQLLETTDMTVDQVARAAGFGTAASLRARMRELLGVAPSSYRRTFRAGRV